MVVFFAVDTKMFTIKFLDGSVFNAKSQKALFTENTCTNIICWYNLDTVSHNISNLNLVKWASQTIKLCQRGHYNLKSADSY